MTSRMKVINSGLLFSLLLIAGCGSDAPTAPTTDFIALDSIAPAAGTTLTAGERVTFTAVVTCTLVSANGGFTAMVIQDQANRVLRVEEEMQTESTLSRGTATVTLRQTIRVPASGSTVTVALPIFVDGSTTTQAVVRREYSVR